MNVNTTTMDVDNTTIYIDNTTTPTNISESPGVSGSHSSNPNSIYYSIAFIYIPGLLTNTIALVFIVKDYRKAVFPAIVLLLYICVVDLLAVVVSFARHVFTRNVTLVTYEICAILVTVHPYFRLYSGFLNGLMAIDRYLAICTPFLYKSKVGIQTWKRAAVVGALVCVIITLFPVIGLGDVWKTRRRHGKITYYCTGFSYFPDVRKRMYGIATGLMCYTVVILIVACNCLVIKTVLSMKRAIVSIGPNGVPQTHISALEVPFAKLMGALALVYLICATPYNTSILLQQFDISIEPSVVGAIHLLAGLSYTIDPIVYILIRKTHRNRLINIILRCKFQKEDPGIEF